MVKTYYGKKTKCERHVSGRRPTNQQDPLRATADHGQYPTFRDVVATEKRLKSTVMVYVVTMVSNTDATTSGRFF